MKYIVSILLFYFSYCQIDQVDFNPDNQSAFDELSSIAIEQIIIHHLFGNQTQVSNQAQREIMEIIINTNNAISQLNQSEKNNYKELALQSEKYLLNITDSEKKIIIQNFKYFENQTDEHKNQLLQFIIQNITQSFQNNTINQQFVKQTLTNIDNILQLDSKNTNQQYENSTQQWIQFQQTIPPQIKQNLIEYLNQTNQTLDFDINSGNLTAEQENQLQELLMEYFQYQAEQDSAEDQDKDQDEGEVEDQEETNTSPKETVYQNESNELSLFLIILILFLSTLALVGLLLFRRYMNRRKLLPFRMNDELTGQGVQAI